MPVNNAARCLYVLAHHTEVETATQGVFYQTEALLLQPPQNKTNQAIWILMDSWARGRYQGQKQVITSHSYCTHPWYLLLQHKSSFMGYTVVSRTCDSVHSADSSSELPDLHTTQTCASEVHAQWPLSGHQQVRCTLQWSLSGHQQVRCTLQRSLSGHQHVCSSYSQDDIKEVTAKHLEWKMFPNLSIFVLQIQLKFWIYMISWRFCLCPSNDIFT